MGKVKWTEEQLQAIYQKDKNILVAAAAGSGKTAVLVERMIHKMIDEKVDIDRILIVTFTNAAASEMRERILEALYAKIEENPYDKRLQNQIILLNKSSICTIHSFCLDVIRNYFYELNLSSNFRIGNSEEIEILKQDVLEEYFEELYEEENEKFQELVQIYADYKSDETLKEIVLKIYAFIQSNPFPEQWLEEKVEMFSEKTSRDDFEKSKWGSILLNELKEELFDCVQSLKVIQKQLQKEEELVKFQNCIGEDIEKITEILKLCDVSWDSVYEAIHTLKLKTWPTDKKIENEQKEIAKQNRNVVREKIKKIKNQIMLYSSKDAYEGIFEMHSILKEIQTLVIGFSKRFQAKKIEKNMIDFNDIEHYALQILVRKDENGDEVATEIAKKYQEKFVEIAIDEYQDSNLVQEYILSKISRRK